jgi:predicted GNAT family N-acyltransferase
MKLEHNAHTTTFCIVSHGSPQYLEAVALREKILRTPLGLSFTPEEIAAESDHSQIHIVGLQDHKVVATCVFVDRGNRLCKMQRVAVDDTHQGQGLGAKMLDFFHKYAQFRGFHSVYCHARKTAESFYKKHGYHSEGEDFEEQSIPHVTMRKKFL